MSAEPAGAGDETHVLLIEDLSQQRLPARSLVAVLSKAGVCPHIVDSNADPDSLVCLALALEPRLIVFSLLFADKAPEYLALIEALRGAGVRAHITLVGPLPSLAYAQFLNASPGLDSVLYGEPEPIIAQLAVALGKGEDWQTIPGLAARAPALGPLAPAPLDLDTLPQPWRDDEAIAGQKHATVQASRGCYHACGFCLPCAFYRRIGAGYRLRSIPNLVDEMQALYRRKVRLFLFDDEQFLAPGRARADRVNEFARELKRRRLEVAFTIKCRPDDVDRELFLTLQNVGLVRVYAGIESGCQATLDRLGKGATVEQNAAALARLDELGITADFRCLMFHPWSTCETVRADIEFLRTHGSRCSTPFSFHEMEVYAGTPLASRLIAEGRADARQWQLEYGIKDPRVELLRRFNHLMSSPTGGLERTQQELTRASFDLLCQNRFDRSPESYAQVERLKQITRQLNGELLDLWQEILSFVETGDIGDAARVNARAAEWMERVNLYTLTKASSSARMKSLARIRCSHAAGRTTNQPPVESGSRFRGRMEESK